MAQKQEIYVSVDLNEYRRSKVNILASQADIIDSNKHLLNLRQLLHQEKNLKIKLHELFSSVSDSLKELEDSIPTAKLPKSIREKTPQTESEQIFEQPSAQGSIMDQQPQQPDPVDLELQEIQDKLKALNT